MPNVPRNLEECSATQSTNQIVAGEETIQVQDSNQSDAKKNKTFTSKQLGEGLETRLRPDQDKHERHASDVV